MFAGSRSERRGLGQAEILWRREGMDMGPGPQCESWGRGQDVCVYLEEFGQSESQGKGPAGRRGSKA